MNHNTSASLNPTKPIGAVYDAASVARLERERGWTFAADGSGYRRVVPSPEPISILAAHSIELLVDAGVLVICAGGGGIPVVRKGHGLRGVAAVIDKDLASALLAETLDADVLLLLTDQPGVFENFGTDHASLLRDTSPEELAKTKYAPGSMGPKVDAATRFVTRTGGRAVIGALDDAVALFAGVAGTQVRTEPALRHP